MQFAIPTLALLLTVVFAGCAGGGASTTEDPQSSVAAPTEFVEGAATIVGLVMDDENAPLEGVTVALLELNLQVVSNIAGAFEFQNVPPGTYRLAAQKLGYESTIKSLEAKFGETHDVAIILEALNVETAYHEVVGPLSGYFQCRASVYTYSVGTGPCGYTCPGVTCVNPWSTSGVNPFTGDNSILKFNITSENVATVVGDMRWTPSAYGTSGNMRFAFSYEKRVGSHWWCSGEGRSPLQFVWNADGESQCANTGATKTPEKPMMKDAPFRIYANVPFATATSPVQLSYEQKFEMFGTIFYVDPAPAGYSALGDT